MTQLAISACVILCLYSEIMTSDNKGNQGINVNVPRVIDKITVAHCCHGNNKKKQLIKKISQTQKFCSYIKKVCFHINKICPHTKKRYLLTNTKKPTVSSHCKFPRQILTANSRGKFLQQISTAKSCGKFSRKITPANSRCKSPRQILEYLM